jgi:hypothetical protein
MSINSFPQPELKEAYESQNTMGWYQFLLARISAKWRRAFIKLKSPKSTLIPATWAARVVMAIWTYTHSVWKDWNHSVHQSSLAIATGKNIKESHSKVVSLYNAFNNGPFSIPQHLRYLFDRPLATSLKMSEDAICCWVNTVEEALRTQKLIQQKSTYSRNCMA